MSHSARRAHDRRAGGPATAHAYALGALGIVCANSALHFYWLADEFQSINFLMALVLVPQNPDVQTAPLALSFFAGSTRNFDPSVTAAAAVIVAVPILVVYAIFQRRFITGVVAGAVKE